MRHYSFRYYFSLYLLVCLYIYIYIQLQTNKGCIVFIHISMGMMLYLIPGFNECRHRWKSVHRNIVLPHTMYPVLTCTYVIRSFNFGRNRYKLCTYGLVFYDDHVFFLNLAIFILYLRLHSILSILKLNFTLTATRTLKID